MGESLVLVEASSQGLVLREASFHDPVKEEQASFQVLVYVE